uniref:Mannose-6-phosphate isomerase n=1 Tax=mine drainage metagenome TaxID=410659 RepID=E6PXF2_9ZZZZ
MVLEINTTLQPFRLTPEFVHRVWGFHDLRPWYDHSDANDPIGPIGEAWLTGDNCTAACGALQGHTLAEICAMHPSIILGERARGNDSPLLIKMLFAREKLSVQVHPDDAMAQKYGQPRGKTECWYALAAKPEAKVACGLRPGATKEKIEAGIHDGTLEEWLNILPIAAGDMVYVDAGTVHAIWPGSILLETQQNCDITYRMFDYGRPRELHVEKSLEATHLTTRAGKVAPREESNRTVLLDERYFRIERLKIDGSIDREQLNAMDTEPTLSYLFVASGSGRLTGDGFADVALPERSMTLVPAKAPEFVVHAETPLELIRISARWPDSSAR